MTFFYKSSSSFQVTSVPSSGTIYTELEGKTMRKSILKQEGDESKQLRRKTICWGDLAIFEFPNILGDNPGVSEGVPLTIGWKHENKSVIGIDYYEYLRQSRPRRRRKDLIMPSAARDTFLLGLGYNLEQLVNAAEETKKIRRSRMASMKGNTWGNKLREVFEFRQRKHQTTVQPKIVVAKSG